MSMWTDSVRVRRRFPARNGVGLHDQGDNFVSINRLTQRTSSTFLSADPNAYEAEATESVEDAGILNKLKVTANARRRLVGAVSLDGPIDITARAEPLDSYPYGLLMCRCSRLRVT